MLLSISDLTLAAEYPCSETQPRAYIHTPTQPEIFSECSFSIFLNISNIFSLRSWIFFLDHKASRIRKQNKLKIDFWFKILCFSSTVGASIKPDITFEEDDSLFAK